MATEDHTTLGELKKLVSHFRDERDWKQFHKPKDLAISVSVEAGELLELFQWKTDSEVRNILDDPAKLEQLKHEIADIVVYCLAMSDIIAFDLADAIRNKLESNAKKYPIDKSKGKATKYTELD